MHTDNVSLWQQLVNAALVQGEMPESSRLDSPWYIRAMMGIAGWFAALFLLGFFVVAFEIFKSGSGSLAIGSMLCIMAVTLARATDFEDFGQQFGFALSLTGQALILIGLMKSGISGRDEVFVASGMAIVEAILFVLINTFVHRVWSAAAGLFALTWAMSNLGLPDLAPAIVLALAAFIWLNEFAWSRYGSMVRALAYGATFMSLLPMFYLSLFGGLGLRLFEPEIIGLFGVQRWLALWVSAAVLMVVVYRLLMREVVSPASRIGLAAFTVAALMALASLWAPGLPVVLVALLLGFANGNRILVGVGLFALLAYLSQYYYWLQYSLLYKSILLVCTGSILLAVRFALNALFSGGAREDGAHA